MQCPFDRVRWVCGLDKDHSLNEEEEYMIDPHLLGERDSQRDSDLRRNTRLGLV